MVAESNLPMANVPKMTAAVVGNIAAARESRVRGRVSTRFMGLGQARRLGWESH
jgi:hypothetical protein